MKRGGLSVADDRKTTEERSFDTDGTAADYLSLDPRKQIFEYIQAHPGSHFSKVKRELGMETGLLQYHLRTLEEYDIIESNSIRASAGCSLPERWMTRSERSSRHSAMKRRARSYCIYSNTVPPAIAISRRPWESPRRPLRGTSRT